MNHAELRAVLFTDMTNEAYHADKGSISSSGLKQILLSPGHLRHYLDQPHVETTPLRVGTAIHTALLEPEKFGDEYVISPEFNRRTNQGKANEAAFLAEAKANNRKVVTERELAMLHGIRDSVSRHRMATHLLSVGKAEQSVFWTDAETGVRLRVRFDLLCPGLILDVKSTQSAHRDDFPRHAKNYDYDLSAAMYAEGYRQYFGEEPEFSFLACEKEAPYACALYRAPEQMMERGRQRFRRAVELYARCVETNSWPSYQPDGGFEDLGWYFKY